ncbi:MAG: hypothetical protein M1819_001003 [Sarea resinae]|nr:MAG: hypothetical protein M1819_001003 [Sarea resinae]
MKKSPSSPPPAANRGDKESLLSRSAQGVSFLILLQIGSRALTFVVNQILLRYLSPELLGISTQLELYSISVLYFSRECLRVALQRVPDSSDGRSTSEHDGGKAVDGGVAARSRPRGLEGDVDADTPSGKLQATVNTSYIAIVLGVPLAYVLGHLYLRSSIPSVPFLKESLVIYGTAAVVELFTEPGFIVTQTNMLYKVRASAEATATTARCLIACGSAIGASMANKDAGVLPFALGQMGYSLVLFIVYYWKLNQITELSGLSFLPKRLFSRRDQSQYIFSYLSRPLCALGVSLYVQSAVKYVLTQGDSFIVAAYTSLQDQGAYALASNYGGLIARMVFQPVEESSRNLFAKLLAPPSSDDEKRKKDDDEAAAQGLHSARNILHSILKLYLLLSTCACALGPTMAPQLLRLVAGSRWADTSAARVLATYCYYIPLLALNGITEAFVAAAASSADLHGQSGWMLAFFGAFAAAAYAFLHVLAWGAEGLVYANAVNMALRIAWSWHFVGRYLRRRGAAALEIRDVVPRLGTVSAGLGVAVVLRAFQSTARGQMAELVGTSLLAVPFYLL